MKTNLPICCLNLTQDLVLYLTARCHCVSTYLWIRAALRVFLISVVMCVASRASDFEAEGTLTIATFLQDGKVFRSGDFHFFAAANETHWLITAFFGENHFQKFGCDGTNVYNFVEDPGSPRTDVVPGAVTPGNYPTTGTWHTTIPWLVYASRSFFAGDITNAVVLPAVWRDASDDLAAYIYRVDFTSTNLAFGVPREIDYIVDHSLVTNLQPKGLLVSTNFAGQQRTTAETLIALTKDKRKVASLKILTTRKIDGIDVPSEFRFEAYYESGKPFLRATGIAKRVARSSMAEYLPRTDKSVSIRDYRFADAKVGLVGIPYVVNRGEWITDAQSAELARVFSQTKEQLSGTLHRHWIFERFSRGFFLAVFAFVSLFPFLLYVYLRFRRRNPRQTTIKQQH